MTGADLLCDTLLVNGIDVCFANPGTSEMAFVAALDRKPQMRCILGLFEGVATGAADGYGRMAGKPAATLLHTGPGLANGLANLHNAHRARTPVVNIVGDHATYHLKYDAPLTTDIESLARPMSDWVGRATTPGDVGMTAEAAIIAARTTPGVATMILPADAAWGESDARAAAQPVAIPAAPAVAPERIREIAAAIRGRRIAVLVGGEAARGEALAAANTICATAGGKLLTEVLTPRVERGRGRPDAARIPYPIDAALAVFKELDVLVLAGAPEQVAFFAYPGRPSRLVPSTCAVLTLARKDEDQLGALLALADEIGAKAAPLRLLERLPDSMPAGPLTDDALSIILARLLPENAILADEGLTSARRLYALSTDAAPHDYLMVTGGSIGLGVPLATGAAIACPDRKVVAVQADGSAMYTLQGLWTQAREQLDVLTIILSNRMYATLRTELANLGVNQVGRNATRMMTLDDPPLDWVSLARGMGVEGARAETCERFAELLREGLARRGPMLIEAVL